MFFQMSVFETGMVFSRRVIIPNSASPSVDIGFLQPVVVSKSSQGHSQRGKEGAW